MRRLAGSALAGAAALLTVPAAASVVSAASAATLPKLPVTGLTQVLAAGNHLFLDTGDSVVVTSLTGKPVTTLPGGATGNMATNGNTVWVVAGQFLHAFSATTLNALPNYDGPASNNLYNIAYQAGKIWVVYGGSVPTSIGYFNVGNPGLNANVLTTATPWAGIPRLVTDPNPTTEGTLVAVDNEAASSMMVTYNVSGGTPQLTPVMENDAVAGCTGLSDLAVTAGGGRAILACTGGTTDLTYATKTLAPVAAADYASGAGPDAVAVTPDNTGIATGTNDAGTSTVKVFKAGGGAAVTSVPLAADGLTVAPGGLAWSQDATHLYAVLKGGADYYLDVLQYPQYKASTLDLTSPKFYWQAGAKVVLRGKLDLGGAPAPAGVTVKIFRQVVGTSALTTLTTHTVAGGTYTYSDVPPKYAHYYYTAYYATNGTYAPNWHSCLVVVNALHTTLRVTAPGSVSSGATVQVTAHLGKTYNSRVVAIYAQPAGGAKKLVKKAKVNSSGALTISYKVTKNTTFTAVFAGDAHYAPVTAKATVKG
jgi:hypothetical protein